MWSKLHILVHQVACDVVKAVDERRWFYFCWLHNRLFPNHRNVKRYSMVFEKMCMCDSLLFEWNLYRPVSKKNTSGPFLLFAVKYRCGPFLMLSHIGVPSTMHPKLRHMYSVLTKCHLFTKGIKKTHKSQNKGTEHREARIHLLVICIVIKDIVEEMLVIKKYINLCTSVVYLIGWYSY